MRVLTCDPAQLGRLTYSWDAGSLVATTHDTIRWRDRGVVRWVLGANDTPVVLDCGGVVVSDVFSLPDGRLIVGGFGTSPGPFASVVLVVDPGGAEPPWPLPESDRAFGICVSPTGDRLLIQRRSANGCPILASFRLPLRPSVEPEWTATANPPEGKRLNWLVGIHSEPTRQRLIIVEGTGSRWSIRPSSMRAHWRSSETGQPVGKPRLLPKESQVGTHFAANAVRLIGFDKAALLSFDLTDPKADPMKVTSRTRKHFTGLAVHPDGRRVFATCNDETVREYDAVTLHELRAYDWKVGKLRCIAVAPDGLTAAVGSDTGKVVVWDLA